MAKARTRKAKAATAPDATAQTGPGVDEILAQLETVVEQLEDGQLPLESALAAFEKGVGLVRDGERLLAGIEQRVEQLLEDGESTVPFEVDADEGEL